VLAHGLAVPLPCIGGLGDRRSRGSTSHVLACTAGGSRPGLPRGQLAGDIASLHGNVVLGYENLPAGEIARQVLAILRPFMDWWTDDFVQTLTHTAGEPAWAYLRSTVEQMSELATGEFDRLILRREGPVWCCDVI
jgi:hypothetical protein